MKKRLVFCMLLMPTISTVAMKRPAAAEDVPPAKASRAAAPLPVSELPIEVRAEILLQIPQTPMRGATNEQKLYNAIDRIRAYMEAFPEFYGDEQIAEKLITLLANRYSAGNTIRVAILLATTGAAAWLRKYVGNEINKKRLIAKELIHATENGDIGTVRFILTQFPDLINDQTDSEKRTILIIAAASGMSAIVNYVVQIPGINVNTQNQQGATALMSAALNGHTAVVERLVQVPGINVNANTQQGATALMFAAKNGHTAVVERLVQVPGINVNKRNQAARTALGYARESNSPNKNAIIKMLIAHGATE